MGLGGPIQVHQRWQQQLRRGRRVARTGAGRLAMESNKPIEERRVLRILLVQIYSLQIRLQEGQKNFTRFQPWNE